MLVDVIDFGHTSVDEDAFETFLQELASQRFTVDNVSGHTSIIVNADHKACLERENA